VYTHPGVPDATTATATTVVLIFATSCEVLFSPPFVCLSVRLYAA